MTKLYLAVQDSDLKAYGEELSKSKYLLISYYYNKDPIFIENVDYIVDSGAFTFMNGRKIDQKSFEIYVDDYIEYIKKYKFKKYLELDVDSIWGLDYVKKIREKLEKEIGYQCIPVWHKSRGRKEFEKMVEEYKYIAIGGIAIGDIKRKDHGYFKVLNTYARKKGCKVHGLGFTPTSNLNDYGFYSCDSTSWVSGSKHGSIYQFNHNRIRTLRREGQRIKAPISLNKYNIKEWIKYQNYVDIEN